MGLHFETCLSPHDINFFSTIANAVDINKRVAYAKTESGRVIGRCLLALTDQGTLLTYNRYAHNPKDRFDKQFDRFAMELAEAMNTVLAESGRVSTLVARKWYDDGAISYAQIYDLNDKDGPVRTILRTEAPSGVLERLIAALESETILKNMLGPLLSLEEFQQRPEIIEPFVERFAFETAIPAYLRFRLAVLGRSAGQEDTARQVIKAIGINALLRSLRGRCYCCCGEVHGIGAYGEVFGLLVDYHPSIALRALRQTRPGGVKTDADEEDPVRKEMFARCYKRLRPGNFKGAACLT